MVTEDKNADLLCTDCKERIGSNRLTCRPCNSFAQKAYRRAMRQLRERHHDEYKAVLVQAERGLYAESTAG